MWEIEKSISKNFMVGEDCRRHTPPNKLMKWVRGDKIVHMLYFDFWISHGGGDISFNGCFLPPLISVYWAIICSFEKTLYERGRREEKWSCLVYPLLKGFNHKFQHCIQESKYYIKNILASLKFTPFYFPLTRKMKDDFYIPNHFRTFLKNRNRRINSLMYHDQTFSIQ